MWIFGTASVDIGDCFKIIFSVKIKYTKSKKWNVYMRKTGISFR
jgi:hypothetical protein